MSTAARRGGSLRARALTPQGALVLFFGTYLLLQLTLFSLRRPPSWDEAIYLSQVKPGALAARFVASRARGITFLVAPVLWAGGSLTAVRAFLAVASSAALTGAAWVWIPAIGWGAVAAAVVLGSSWLTLFYGSEVMPNLWAAILGLGAAGFAVRHLLRPRGRRELWLAGLFLGLMALFRPFDAAALAVVLGAFVVAGERSARALVPLAVGLATGIAPWIVEMSVRFGGPLSALRDAVHSGYVGTGGAGHAFREQLALSNGPVAGRGAHTGIPALGVAWWAGLVALCAMAVARTRRSPAFRAVLLMVVAGVVLALQYLVFVSAVEPRFLLPAYAMLALGAGIGLSRLSANRVWLAATVAAVAVWAVLQIATANRIEADQVSLRAAFGPIGSTLRDLAGNRPCAFASTGGFPQIQLASGCRGTWLLGGIARESAALRSEGRSGAAVFLVLSRTEHPPKGWTARRQVVGPRGEPWVIYRPG